MDVGSEGRRVRGSEDRRVQRSDGQRVGRSEDQRVRDFEGQSVIASLTWTGSHSAENPLISPKSARWPRGARCEVLCEDPGPDSLHSDTPVLDDLVGQRSGEANDRALGRGVVEELMPISQQRAGGTCAEEWRSEKRAAISGEVRRRTMDALSVKLADSGLALCL
jgi:hypothetical protein